MSPSSPPAKRASLPRQVQELLHRVAEKLRAAPVSQEKVARLAWLAEQVHQPCTLAVVGAVKAGKSTFINALLGQELAKAGVTETTATVNFFRYGRPDDPQRPVRCHYQNGYSEDISLQQANALQGHDSETLRRLKEVDRLEFRLEHPLLERIVLVDTPGLGSGIREHQDEVEAFLFERNIDQTKTLCQGADAVVYLVGAVAREADQKTLDRFQQSLATAQTSALNTVGVLAKVDLSPELLRRRQELADHIASQLKDQLNTVVPVSAALQLALESLLADEGRRLQQIHETFSHLRQNRPRLLQELLADEGLYQELDAPISPEQRRQMKGNMPWGVFRTVVETCLACDNADQAREQLERYAGFDRLLEALEENFFRRTDVLRCHRVLEEAWRLLKWEIHNDPNLALPGPHWLAVLDQVETLSNREVMEEIRTFISKHIQASENLQQELDQAVEKTEELLEQVSQQNQDFDSLIRVEKCKALSGQERMELRHLFGLYGADWETRLRGKTNAGWIENRHNYWREQAQVHADEQFRKVADRAAQAYWQAFRELGQRDD